MSARYAAIKWSINKRRYDQAIAVGGIGFVTTFVLLGRFLYRDSEALSIEVLFIRALGACAITMLHIVLCIGPLARFDYRFAPLLYNRRHLGVMTFLVALAHGALVTGYYHGFGIRGPLVSLLTSNNNFNSWSAFPFELLGIGALAILFLLASISHDFWQKMLGASVWKSLHMLVYVAYALVVFHVGLGALQSERSAIYPALIAGGVVLVSSLHLAAAYREARRDRHAKPTQNKAATCQWIDAGLASDIPLNRAKIVTHAGRERIAIFRHASGISAVSNVCAHQRGPLGEGKVVDGCITCPWHGWQYLPENGRSPPPFHEKIPTYATRCENGRVFVDPNPQPPGTAIPPSKFEGGAS